MSRSSKEAIGNLCQSLASNEIGNNKTYVYPFVNFLMTQGSPNFLQF